VFGGRRFDGGDWVVMDVWIVMDLWRRGCHA
jgi:hypothetical protein